MDEFGEFLTTALAIITIATLAGAGLMRGTVTGLRERVGDLTGENEALKKGRIEDKTTIATLNADVAALQRIVTGEVHWVALGQQLDEHHASAEGHWQETEDSLKEMQGTLLQMLLVIKDNHGNV